MRRPAFSAPATLAACIGAAMLSIAVSAVPIYAQDPAKPMGSMPGMQSPKRSAQLSSGLTLTIDGKATTFTLSDLSAMPQKTVTITNPQSKATQHYTGVGLDDLLAKGGFSAGSVTHEKMLHSYVRAEGTDHYWVLYAVAEVEPSEHTGDVIIATSVDGHGLGEDGQLKLVSTEEKKPARWVRNLAAIAVETAQ